MQKENPTTDFPEDSLDSSSTTFNDLFQQQIVEQNVFFQQNLLQQNEESRLKFEAKIEKIVEENKIQLQSSQQLFSLESLEENKRNIEEKIANLKNEFGDLINNLTIRSFKMKFVKLENNWDKTDGECCNDKCILSNPDGNCKKGNGIVKLSGGKVEYLKGNNNRYIHIFAKNVFKKSVDFSTSPFNFCTSLIFYFEVTLIRKNENWFYVGLNSNKCTYRVNSNGDYWDGSHWNEKFFPRKLKDGDVVGCGLILPSTLFSDNNRPNLFFTLNGKKFDNYCVLENEDINADFLPVVYLNECSVDANFGEKEFSYKIEKAAI